MNRNVCPLGLNFAIGYYECCCHIIELEEEGFFFTSHPIDININIICWVMRIGIYSESAKHSIDVGILTNACVEPSVCGSQWYWLGGGILQITNHWGN